jgi:hypothetical protein
MKKKWSFRYLGKYTTQNTAYVSEEYAAPLHEFQESGRLFLFDFYFLCGSAIIKNCVCNV